MPIRFSQEEDSSGTRKRKVYTPEEALAKIYKYCAYQERSHQEVKNKLFGFGLHTGDVDDLMSRLVTDGFLNEERFAKAYSGGKFRIKQWGRIKIENELRASGLSNNCIQIGLKEIKPDDYIATLKKLLQKKASSLMEPDLFKKRNRLARYAIGKGYESEMAWKIILDLVPMKG